MFQFPGLAVLAIAATRVYRSLTDLVTRGTHISIDNIRDRLPMPNVVQTPVGQIPLNQIEVTVHTTRVQDQTNNDGSFTSTDREGQHKPAELVSDEGQERDIEG